MDSYHTASAATVSDPRWLFALCRWLRSRSSPVLVTWWELLSVLGEMKRLTRRPAAANATYWVHG
jgi:hypothetical protein